MHVSNLLTCLYLHFYCWINTLTVQPQYGVVIVFKVLGHRNYSYVCLCVCDTFTYGDQNIGQIIHIL